jgi:hypothetical protein
VALRVYAHVFSAQRGATAGAFARAVGYKGVSEIVVSSRTRTDHNNPVAPSSILQFAFPWFSHYVMMMTHQLAYHCATERR